ncbi:MAG: TetR/AcrR family transcriptional regulator [Bacillota bacterium]|nr:TetR/AcrR family transcriptional regulator [Bacillota bacterium]
MARGAETKERIIATARGLFAQQGYQGATMSQIAREVGITEGAIYRHFADKRELFMACIGPALKEAVARSLEELQDATDLRTLVRRMIEVRLQVLEEHRDTFCILFTQALHQPELWQLLRELIATQVKSAEPAVAMIWQLGGRRRPPALMLGVGLTMALWALLNFPTQNGELAEGEGPSPGRQKTIDELTDFVLYGIAGEPGRGSEQ